MTLEEYIAQRTATVRNKYANDFIKHGRQLFEQFKEPIAQHILDTSPDEVDGIEKIGLFLRINETTAYNIDPATVMVLKAELLSILHTSDLDTISTEHVHIYKDDQAQEYVVALIAPKNDYYNLREPIYDVWFIQVAHSNGQTHLVINANNMDVMFASMALILPTALPIHWNECQQQDVEDLTLDV